VLVFAGFLVIFTAILLSPDTTSANPVVICAVPKRTLEGGQSIHVVIEAFMFNHISDLLNQGNRIIPRPLF
jgi:hypothetical protein